MKVRNLLDATKLSKLGERKRRKRDVSNLHSYREFGARSFRQSTRQGRHAKPRKVIDSALPRRKPH